LSRSAILTWRRTALRSVILTWTRTTLQLPSPRLCLESHAGVMTASQGRPVPEVNSCRLAAVTTRKAAMACMSLQTVALASPPLVQLQKPLVGAFPPRWSPAAKGGAKSSWTTPMCLPLVHQEHHPCVSVGPRGRSAQSVVEMQCSSQRVTNAPDSSRQAQADAEVRAAVRAPKLQPSAHQQCRPDLPLPWPSRSST